MVSTGRPTIGLALGGGAARGWAHIGVLKSLVSAGLMPDIVAGTSMGAVAGACYVTGKLNALEDFATSLTRRRLFGFLDFNFGGSGLISGQRLSARLERHLQHFEIERLDRKFVAVATELGTGHEVWLNKGSLVDALRASFALPGIFRPVQINGRWLIDGALVNPIPVSVCRALGARIVIAVNLSSDPFGRGGVIHDHGILSEPAPIVEEAELPGTNGRAAVHLLHRQIFGRSDGAPGHFGRDDGRDQHHSGSHRKVAARGRPARHHHRAQDRPDRPVRVPSRLRSDRNRHQGGREADRRDQARGAVARRLTLA